MGNKKEKELIYGQTEESTKAVGLLASNLEKESSKTPSIPTQVPILTASIRVLARFTIKTIQNT